MSEDEETPGLQRLKGVTILQCVAGRAYNLETGPPIAILTVGHRGEVEEPMAICLKDIAKLAEACLRVMERFGDPDAAAIVAQYFVGRDDEEMSKPFSVTHITEPKGGV